MKALAPFAQNCANNRKNIQTTRSKFRMAGLSAALILGMPSLTWAQISPFDIDGVVPDEGVEATGDPSGSVQELGPVNGSVTKIGVIHGAGTPMLDFTNPNGQTDLVNVWLDIEEQAGDIWLYFAWERDSFKGSSVITYEFQHSAFPAGCVYTENIDMVEPVHPDEADLIANCNPWSARQKDDFLIVWDFKGGSTEIILRTFDGSDFIDTALDANWSEAALNGNTSRGEGAINLSEAVFDETSCTSIGSVITGTVTGNSDSADYKDTVITDVAGRLTISNCGVVKIRKQTDPHGVSGSFEFTHNLDFLGTPAPSPFTLSDDGVQEYSNVVAPGTGYFVDETAPGADFVLSAIDCSASDESVAPTRVLNDGRVNFDLDRGETLDCTFVNSQKPKLTVYKSVDVGSSVDEGSAGPNDFALTQGGVGVNSGETITHDLDATVSIGETQLDGFEFVGITGDDKCPEDLGGSTATLEAGDDIVCTVTNALQPKLTVTKVVVGGGALPDEFALTQGGESVDSGETVTHRVGDTVSIGETQIDGFEFVSITGAKCPANPGGSTAILEAGDDIECIITNRLKPRVTLVKSVSGGEANPDDFSLTQDDAPVESGQTVIHDVDDTVVLNEGSVPGYAFVEIDGHEKCPSAPGGATQPLAAGDNFTCTITNALQFGAIRIQKTRMYAAAADDANFDGNAGDEPHAGVSFEISGGGLDSPIEVVTKANGEVCVDDLAFSAVGGDYIVSEIVPAGYVADGDETATPGDPTAATPVKYSEPVTVDQVGDCDNGNEETVSFGNTPLTDVTIAVDAQDPDATRSRVNCYQATMEGEAITLGDPIEENETFVDDVSVGLDDQLPAYPDSMIVCTIEIDP